MAAFRGKRDRAACMALIGPLEREGGSGEEQKERKGQDGKDKGWRERRGKEGKSKSAMRE